MAKRPRKNHLDRWEIALIKAMLTKSGTNDQDILAYFTRPNRSINHRAIGEIRRGGKHTRVRAASNEELADFISNCPLIDWDTGLHLHGDELLIKAREAMLNAVQTYNNPKTWFRSEIFIISAVIAWTYLLHAYFKGEGVDYRYYETREGRTQVTQTKNGAECFWELAKCLKAERCPIDGATKKNLEFLLEIRHEIEHRMTRRIDDAISAKLQACCHNFNTYLKNLFGHQLGLDSELSFALQFTHLSLDQQHSMARAQDLPENVLLAQTNFEDRLSDEIYNDNKYAVRVALVPKSVSRKGKADQVVEVIRADSEEAEAVSRVLLKEMEKRKFKPTRIVEMMIAEGYPLFSLHNHTLLWKALDAKAAGKPYGVTLGDGQWYWYETWVERVREHCREKAGSYQ